MQNITSRLSSLAPFPLIRHVNCVDQVTGSHVPLLIRGENPCWAFEEFVEEFSTVLCAVKMRDKASRGGGLDADRFVSVGDIHFLCDDEVVFGTDRSPLYYALKGRSREKRFNHCSLHGIVSVSNIISDGLTFHRHDENWLECLVGEKMWMFMPPKVKPSAAMVKVDEVITNHGKTMIWCTQKAGDVVYIPPNWWHSTMNLSPSVAVGGMGASKGLHYEVAENDSSVVSAASDGEIKDATSAMGKTLFHTACYSGHVDMVKLLVERDVIDVEAIDEGGRTGGDWARMRGREEVCEYLEGIGKVV